MSTHQCSLVNLLLLVSMVILCVWVPGVLTEKTFVDCRCKILRGRMPFLLPNQYCQSTHDRLRLTPLRMRSTTGCQQPPEWSVLGQAGRLRRSMTAHGSRGHSAPSSSRSSAVFLVVSSNTQKARKSRSALRLHCHPFGRYARIGLDAVPG